MTLGLARCICVSLCEVRATLIRALIVTEPAGAPLTSVDSPLAVPPHAHAYGRHFEGVERGKSVAGCRRRDIYVSWSRLRVFHRPAPTTVPVWQFDFPRSDDLVRAKSPRDVPHAPMCPTKRIHKPKLLLRGDQIFTWTYMYIAITRGPERDFCSALTRRRRTGRSSPTA